MAHEMNGDVSSSDDDSVSLLSGLDARRTTGVAEEIVEAELDPGKVPESASCTAEDTHCSNSAPKSGLKALQNVKIPPNSLFNKRNGYGETLLHKACRRDNRAQVKALLQAGININIQDYAGWTALHEASAGGDSELVRELLEAGANVHARSNEGITPLHDAVHDGHYEVVKLLLQYGSYVSAKTLRGLSAMDLAEEENIKMLLQASLAQEQSESQGASQLPIQISRSHSEQANANSGESGGTDGATKAGDSQLKRKAIADANDPSHPKEIQALLEEARRRQAEIAVWPLAGSGDADRLHAALTQTQNVLIEALAKQQLAKDAVAQKFRNVPNHFQQHVLKSHIVSLALRQRTLVKMVLEHMGSVTKYIKMKETSSIVVRYPLNCTYETQQAPQSSPAGKPTSCHAATGSDDQAGQGETGEVTQLSHWSSLPTESVKELKEATASTRSLKVRTGTPTDLPRGHRQSSAPRSGQTSQHNDVEMKQNHALTLPTSEDNHRHLSELIKAGAMARRSTLKLSFKGQVHVARVMSKGSIKDSGGKLFLTTTDWFQSVLGNNAPVSSASVWDKVTYRGRPLSYYLLNAEAAGNAAQPRAEDAAPHGRTRYPQEEELTEAAALKRLMNIRIIHLVNDVELMPISVLDSHWERALSEDW
ncbi:uncharacterized protein LOC142902256 [Nelusetta ayraudi]|uniref:uncharacterized protein LOC142902256 n=1 Tax=Nelusetta ayraudi TaxID=303726 RepID=UPI003F710845